MKEALKLALEALESNHDEIVHDWSLVAKNNEAITTLRTAIEQAEKQEPVAWRVRWPKMGGGYAWIMNDAPLMQEHGFINQPLFTTPPAAQPAPVQEPVAWATMLGSYSHVSWGKDRPDYPIRYEIPLYTTPPVAQTAPDLLNALKRIVDEPNNTMSDGKALKEIIRIARAAIAKAIGEQA